MALNMFLLLSAYYMLKTVRESLILTQGGAAVKTYSSAGQALLLLVLVPTFAAFASRVNRIQLVRWVTLFFVANILVFFGLGRAGVHLGIPFFLWVGIFNVMAVSQYWAFANDIYTPEQGKRLFALVGLGSSGGAWIGSLYAGRLIKALGPYPVMLVAAGVLASCVVLAQWINARQRVRGPRQEAAEAEKPLAKGGAFELIFKDRYLMLIAAMFVVLNIVNTSGEYMLGKLVVADSVARFGPDEASLPEREKFVGGFYGRFFSYVNLAGFLLQMFGVSRILKVAGVGGALFVHPTISLVGSLAVIRAPSLSVVGLAKILDNATDYSLGNTSRHALWLPTSREAKYKAKQAVDSFFMRAGDVIAAAVVFVGERLSLALPAFGAVNALLAGLWILIVSRLAAENKERMAEVGAAAA
jgi:AAA family ATP:ADP antiporter